MEVSRHLTAASIGGNVQQVFGYTIKKSGISFYGLWRFWYLLGRIVSNVTGFWTWVGMSWFYYLLRIRKSCILQSLLGDCKTT